MPEVRIYVADDHALIRQGVRAVLERVPEYTVIGEGKDGRDALSEIEQEKPDVVILDISLPSMSGVEVARQLRRYSPDIKIIMLSQYQDNEYVQELLSYGIHGYVLKNDAGEDLPKAVKDVMEGNMHLSPQITRQVVNNCMSATEETGSVFSLLSVREREVLQLVAEGLSSSAVAAKLFISPATVKTHRANIMKKLKISTNADLIKYSIRNKITQI